MTLGQCQRVQGGKITVWPVSKNSEPIQKVNKNLKIKTLFFIYENISDKGGVSIKKMVEREKWKGSILKTYT